jgi:hypothetical protein
MRSRTRTRTAIAATTTAALAVVVALLAASDGAPPTRQSGVAAQHAGRRSQPPRQSTRTIPLGRTPARVRRFCDAISRRGIPALCPSRWPRRHGRILDGRNLVLPGTHSYLGTFNNSGAGTADAGHVFLGGQPTPFSLSGRAGDPWPRPGQPSPDEAMRLPPHAAAAGRLPRATVVRRARVGHFPAIVIRLPTYPAGGVHGGHVVALWNQRGRGYLISFHFSDVLEPGPSPYTLSQRVRTALRMATSASRAPVR